MIALLPNITAWVSTDVNSLRDPEDAMRDASTFSALLGLVEPSSAAEIEAVREVQV